MLPNDADPSMDKKIGGTQEWLLWVHLNEYVKLKDERRGCVFEIICCT